MVDGGSMMLLWTSLFRGWAWISWGSWFLARAFMKSLSTAKHKLPTVFHYVQNIIILTFTACIGLWDPCLDWKWLHIYEALIWFQEVTLRDPSTNLLTPLRCIRIREGWIWSEDTSCSFICIGDLLRTSIKLLFYSLHNKWFWWHVIKVFGDLVVLVVQKTRREYLVVTGVSKLPLLSSFRSNLWTASWILLCSWI